MFSERLKEIRKERKLTQSEMSKLLDIRQNTYSGYETGNYEPNIDTLIKIADIFKISLDYLVGRK